MLHSCVLNWYNLNIPKHVGMETTVFFINWNFYNCSTFIQKQSCEDNVLGQSFLLKVFARGFCKGKRAIELEGDTLVIDTNLPNQHVNSIMSFSDLYFFGICFKMRFKFVCK